MRSTVVFVLLSGALVLAACSQGTPTASFTVIQGTIISASDAGLSPTDIIIGGSGTGGVAGLGFVGASEDNGSASFEVELSPWTALLELFSETATDMLTSGAGLLPGVTCTTVTTNPPTLIFSYLTKLTVPSKVVDLVNVAGDVSYAYVHSSAAGTVTASCDGGLTGIVPALKTDSTTYDVDLTLAKGWNRVSIDSSKDPIEVRVTSDVTTNQEWQALLDN
jgi:hypothetical protein